MENLSISDLGLMRVLESSTLYIEDPIFRIDSLKEAGPTSTGPKLSIFRLYVENQGVLLGISSVIIWLDTIVSCDKAGRGAGCFEALFVVGVTPWLGLGPLLRLSLSGNAL